MSDRRTGRVSLDWFTKLVSPTRDRWKVVWLDDGFASFAWEKLTSPAPMIETVRLRPGRGMPTSLKLLGGATHNIRHLDLFSTKIHWAPLMFRGLKHLELGSSVGDGMTTDLILDVLANSPDLEYLKISYTQMKISATPFLHPIPLLHLQSIELLFLPGNLVCHFLHHIEAPHCQVIGIQTHSIPDINDSDFVGQSIGSFEPLLRDLHKKSGGSTFCARAGLMEWLSCITPGNGEHCYPRFIIEAKSTSFVSMLRWIGRVVDGADPEGLEVEILISDPNVLQDPEVTSTLRGLRSVTKLCAFGEDRVGQETIRLLRKLDHNHVPILPSLKLLDLTGKDAATEEVLQMVRTRVRVYPSHGSPRQLPDLEIVADTQSTPAWLMPIKSLDFYVITQIRSTAGVRLKFHRHSYSTWEGGGMLAIVWDDERGEPTWM
ncbi:hypothetical protein FS837_000295 [Tulasnella sp. UAMH 9824]|nr:hypothetical protein FS837_000295 [Tulasnella sp. UAMH 9824]